MLNFFVNDNFFSDLDEYISYQDIDVEELEDSWEVTAWESDLETITDGFDIDIIIEHILFDIYPERLPDNEDTVKRAEEAIRQSFDLEKMKSLMPKLCYESNRRFKITKKDLL